LLIYSTLPNPTRTSFLIFWANFFWRLNLSYYNLLNILQFLLAFYRQINFLYMRAYTLIVWCCVTFPYEVFRSKK
jgi:hypothetical protein